MAGGGQEQRDVVRDRPPSGCPFGGEVACHPGKLVIRTFLQVRDGTEADPHEHQLQHGVAPAVLVQVGGCKRPDGGGNKAAFVASPRSTPRRSAESPPS